MPPSERTPEPTDDEGPPDSALDRDRGRVCLDGVRVHSFTASPQTVVDVSNPSSTLSWNISAPPGHCRIYLTVNNLWVATLEGTNRQNTSTHTVRPTATATYTLSGRAYGIQRSLAQLTVMVDLPSVPVELSVSGISCSSEQDGILWSDDEPYVLCFSLNVPRLMFSLVPPRVDVDNLLPRPRVVKVGPWDSVDDNGIIYPAPPNTIWDANSGSIDTPEDAMFIVAVVEHDNSDPDAVRGIVETAMIAEVVGHATSAINRIDFTRRMIAGMTSAVSLAVNAPVGGFSAFIDLDERIDEAKVLPLAQRDLGRAFLGEESHMSLPFKGEGAAYRVYFRLRRA